MYPRISTFSVRNAYRHKGITILLASFLAMLFTIQLVLGTEIYIKIFGESTNPSVYTFILDDGREENTDALIKAMARFKSKIECIILSSSASIRYVTRSGEEVSEENVLVAFYPDVAPKYKQHIQDNGRSADLSAGRLFVSEKNVNLLGMIKDPISEAYPVKIQEMNDNLYTFDGFTMLPDAISYGGIYTSYEKMFELIDHIEVIVVECQKPLTAKETEYLEALFQEHVMGKKPPEAVLTMDILSEVGLLFVVLTLCAFNFSALFEYLFSQRKAEFLVYRICGGNTRHILVSMLTEYLIINVAAVILALPMALLLHVLDVFPITELVLTPRFIFLQLFFFLSIMLSVFLFQLPVLISPSNERNGERK